MEEDSKEYIDKIDVVDEMTITLSIKTITLRIKLRLKSRLKTIKAHKLVEDFTEEAPDVTLARVMTTVVMLISFLFGEEAL